MNRRARAIRLSAALLLLLTACSGAGSVADDIRDAADEIREPDDGQAGETDGAGGEASSPGGGDGADTTGGGEDPAGPDGSDGGAAEPTEPAPTEEPAGPPAPAVDDFGRVGGNGRAILRAAVPRLVVEVDVQQGAPAPSQSALDHLAATLRSVADKPGGISFAGGNTFASDRTEWTSGYLREAAKANRSAYSSSDTVVLYVLYVRGGFYANGEQTNAIGVAYNASEVALFGERWQGLGTLLGSDRAIERAVLVHELGHVLGLVNLTYTSEIAHEDPEHPGHSNSQGSVMYWAIESTLIGQIFSGPPPDTFDDADRADLEGLKSGRY